MTDGLVTRAKGITAIQQRQLRAKSTPVIRRELEAESQQMFKYTKDVSGELEAAVITSTTPTGERTVRQGLPTTEEVRERRGRPSPIDIDIEQKTPTETITTQRTIERVGTGFVVRSPVDPRKKAIEPRPHEFKQPSTPKERLTQGIGFVGDPKTGEIVKPIGGPSLFLSFLAPGGMAAVKVPKDLTLLQKTGFKFKEIVAAPFRQVKQPTPIQLAKLDVGVVTKTVPIGPAVTVQRGKGFVAVTTPEQTITQLTKGKKTTIITQEAAKKTIDFRTAIFKDKGRVKIVKEQLPRIGPEPFEVLKLTAPRQVFKESGVIKEPGKLGEIRTDVTQAERIIQRKTPLKKVTITEDTITATTQQQEVIASQQLRKRTDIFAAFTKENVLSKTEALPIELKGQKPILKFEAAKEPKDIITVLAEKKLTIPSGVIRAQQIEKVTAPRLTTRTRTTPTTVSMIDIRTESRVGEQLLKLGIPGKRAQVGGRGVKLEQLPQPLTKPIIGAGIERFRAPVQQVTKLTGLEELVATSGIAKAPPLPTASIPITAVITSVVDKKVKLEPPRIAPVSMLDQAPTQPIVSVDELTGEGITQQPQPRIKPPSPRERLSLAPILDVPQKPRVGTPQIQRPAQITEPVTQLPQQQILDPIIGLPSTPTITTPSLIPPIPPPIKPGGFILPQFDFFERPGRPTPELRGRRAFKFTPSFTAIALDIQKKGQTPVDETVFTGLELRPIITENGKKKKKKKGVFDLGLGF